MKEKVTETGLVIGGAAVNLGADGAVVGPPRRWLHVEAATLLVGSLIAYSTTGYAWWLVPLTLLIPDVSMVAFVAGTRIGAHAYNVAHATPIPAVVVAVGWQQDNALVLALGLIWIAHIGLDRLVGYGLKYDDHFQHTHLGWIGRSARARDAAAPDTTERREGAAAIHA